MNYCGGESKVCRTPLEADHSKVRCVVLELFSDTALCMCIDKKSNQIIFGSVKINWSVGENTNVQSLTFRQLATSFAASKL